MKPLLLILLSAGLHALAFPPWNITFVCGVALVPLLYVVQGQRPGRAALAGLLWGSAAIWGVAYWVPQALTFYYQQPWWFGLVFCIVASMFFWGSFYAAFATGACWIVARTSGVARPVLISALWVSCELARARLLTGEPWLLLGYALVPHVTLIQVADLGGVYLLSFVVVLVNAALAEMLLLFSPFGKPIDRRRGSRRASRASARTVSEFISFTAKENSVRPEEAPSFGAVSKPVLSPVEGPVLSPVEGGHPVGYRQTLQSVTRIVLPAAIMFLAVYAYGRFRLALPLPDHPSVSLIVVQGNNDLGTQWRREFYGKGLERYLDLTMEAAARCHPNLIIWPESAVTFFLAHEPRYQAVIAEMLAATGADLIIGSPHYEGDDDESAQYFNSAFYVARDGQLGGRYDKTHLLPFAEYFPLRTIEFLRRRFERVRTFTPGDSATLLDTRAGKAAVVICFEGIFPELVRPQMQGGAGLLVNLSNDVWLGKDAGPAQHLAMVTLRAVENRTWVIRATTTGISAIIDPFGRVRTRSATFTSTVLEGQIVPMHVETVYKRCGDVFAYGCVVAAVIGLGLLRWREQRC